MATRVIIRPREYHDSVRLMRVSQAVRLEPGVTEAMVMMATPNNRKILAGSGLLTSEAEAARPDDLVVALVAGDEAAADAALRAAEAALTEQAGSAAAQVRPRTLDAARAAAPEARIAAISVPGAHAFGQARRALELGLHVFLFSDNVPVEDELRLKEIAGEKGLLVMGPDCGTAIIGGAALGFANRVARGPVGIAGASGTGMQEISSLLDTMGSGISQAIGTGGRDLSAAIGGRTMMQALDLLARDPATEVVVVTSKPPAPEVAEAVLDRCRAMGKPVVVNFVGAPARAGDGNLRFASTLAEAARLAAQLAGRPGDLPAAEGAEAWIAAAAPAAGQRYLRGLYAGGTLAYEALALLGDRFGPVRSNLRSGALGLDDPFRSQGHTVVDLGEDAFTQGRAHPMIDPDTRNRRILAEAADPETALILMDLVIGYGAHDHPGAALAATLAEARALAAAGGRDLPVVVTLCGTRGDPQGLDEQIAALTGAGALVARNNAEAVALAARMMEAHHAATA